MVYTESGWAKGWKLVTRTCIWVEGGETDLDVEFE